MIRRFATAIFGLTLTLSSLAHTQLPSIPDTLSPERMKSHLQYQWRLLLVIAILNAKEHGQSPSDFGRSGGRWVSQRWGSDLHPQQFGRDIEVRFRRLGFATQVMEDTDSAFTFYWSVVRDTSAFYRTYGSWGIRVDDLEECITATNVTTTEKSNLLWTASRQGHWRVARIARKP